MKNFEIKDPKLALLVHNALCQHPLEYKTSVTADRVTHFEFEDNYVQRTQPAGWNFGEVRK